MSAVLKIVGGLALEVIGGIMSFYGVPGGIWVARAGTLLMLSGAAEALGPKPPRAPPLSGIDIAYSGTLEPRRLIYGLLKVSGMHAMPPSTSGNNNDYFHQVLCLAGRPITGIVDVYFNQIRIPSANIGAVTGTVNDGLVSGIPAPPAGTVNGNGYNNKAWIRRYDGTQSTVDFILNQAFTVWDASKKGQDIPYLALQFGPFDQGIFSSGVPQVTATLQGHKLYDPRLDSTNGGSGSQRIATPSTWTYSTNPALVLRDYLTTPLGLGEVQTRIDDTLVAAAANKCDEAVTVPIPVLVGLTNWTNGSAVVTGNNSAFQSALVAGGFVKAPNGTMLKVFSIQSDVQFTLGTSGAVAYTGATAAGQVTQFNNASNATSVTQSRYTCNTALDCTARYEDNIAVLAAAMMGYAIYSSGKWRMYAGSWPGTAFALTEDDLVGGLSMQCTTPRKDLYNAVRGNFIDPQQNYQPSEFPPILNAGYVAQDGGETIYVETNFPCCSDRYEAQRNAILMSRQSRNRRVVTAQYGMSAYGVKAWEVGTVTIAEIGWIAQTVRCTSWKFLASGVVELTLQEAYAADWTDPLATDYVVVGINVGPPGGAYLPYPPTALTTQSVAGGIQFTYTLPNQILPGTLVELWEYTANTPFLSSSFVCLAGNTTFYVPKSDTITRYYWIRTRGPNGQVSTTYPAGNGVAGTALSPTQGVWTPWVATGSCYVSDDHVNKYGGSNAWDSGCYSINSYGSCHILVKPNTVGFADISFGLSTNPLASPSYTNINYCVDIYNAGGNYHIFESGGAAILSGSSTASDVFSIIYDGATITYKQNATVLRTVSVAGLTLYGQIALFYPGDGGNNLRFGPTTNIAVTSTGQIDSSAVTNVSQSYTAGPVHMSSTGGAGGLNVASFSPVAQAHDCTIIVTAKFEETTVAVNGTQTVNLYATVAGVTTSASDQPPVNGSALAPEKATLQWQFAYTANSTVTVGLAWSPSASVGPTQSADLSRITLQAEFIKR